MSEQELHNPSNRITCYISITQSAEPDIPVYGTNGQCGWHNTALVQGPGVVLGRKGQGPLGVEWCDTDFWVIDTAYFVTQKNIDLDLKYFYYLVKYIGLNHLKDGTSNPSLSRDTFGLQRLPLPSPQKQREIVKSVELLDRKIELNRQMNQTLESIAQALFKSWFVDFEPVKAKAQARAEGKSEAEVELAAIAALSGKSGLEVEQLPEERRSALAETAGLFGDELVQSELGLIPESWEVRTLDSTLSLIIDHRGKTPTKLGGDWQDEGCPAISAKNLKNGRIVSEESIKYIDDKMYKKWMRDELQIGDVIMTSEAPLGELYYLATNTKFVLSQRLYALRSDPDKLSGAFLYFWLQTDLATHDLHSRATGTTVVGIKQSELRKVQILWPPLKIVQFFSRFAESALAKVASAEQQSQALAQLRDTLLPKLLSGELTLPEATAQAEEALEP